jgi:hypothetical protein
MIRLAVVVVAFSLTGSSAAAMACESWCAAGHTVSAHCHDEMPFSASSVVSGADHRCVLVLKERALVRQDDRRMSPMALLSDVPKTLADFRARSIGGPSRVSRSLPKPLMMLRL